MTLSEFANAGADAHRPVIENTEPKPTGTPVTLPDGETLRRMDRRELAALFDAATQTGSPAA
ncbi:hypothetical protein [Actinoallomurus vinaceus]